MRTLAGRQSLYQAQRGMRNDLIVLYQRVADDIRGTLIRASVGGGTIPTFLLESVTGQAGRTVERMFSLGRQVFDIDGYTPLSAYAERLNYWLAWSVMKVVEPHAVLMDQRLPGDVKRWLLRPRIVQEQLSDPFAQYDDSHRWVDPNGYTLSERIWRGGQQTRLRVDALISDGIHSGKSALEISSELEQFLVPGKLLRTNKPYGKDTSYHGMVLARTEITRAHGQATIASSNANPFVSGIDWALSASHPRQDVCDGLATIGMGGERLKDPYPKNAVPGYPPHPQCLCNLRPAASGKTDGIIARLRAEMATGKQPYATPLAQMQFLQKLLGPYLVNLIRRELAA